MKTNSLAALLLVVCPSFASAADWTRYDVQVVMDEPEQCVVGKTPSPAHQMELCASVDPSLHLIALAVSDAAFVSNGFQQATVVQSFYSPEISILLDELEAGRASFEQTQIAVAAALDRNIALRSGTCRPVVRGLALRTTPPSPSALIAAALRFALPFSSTLLR